MASVIEFDLNGDQTALKESTAFHELADAVGAVTTQAGIFLADRAVA